ncbi:tyrosine--tRNA ligase, partial [Vibrio parahaemolyticus]|nr:tyrosine--tRNA ligase [Vibrio parahaemolyticus]
QMGGSDQWGNIVNGIELARRIDQRQLFGLTTPLLTTSAGAKMGKTASGAVGLNAEKLGAYEFWQFWRNTDDDDVARFLRLFTELPLDEVHRLGQLKGSEINEAKRVLAHEATRLAHGEKAACPAADTARRTFEDGENASGLPSPDLARSQIETGVTVTQLLVLAGLSRSKSEARRLALNGGARLNGQVVQDADARIAAADLVDGALKLTAGKKRHVLVRVNDGGGAA